MVTDAFDLTQLAVGGVIRESVMDQIFDISKIPLPFTDRVGTTSHGNPYFEWRLDRLQSPDVTNAVIDGTVDRTDESGQGATTPVPGEARAGNNSQISVKTLHVSTRAQETDTIGFARTLAYEVMQRGNELRRDVEAMLLQNNANVVDTGSGGVPGESSGLEAWLDDENENNETIFDATGGNPSSYRDQSDGITNIGGWTNKTGTIIDVIDYTAMATPGAITEQAIKDVAEQLYLNGADPTVLMARPTVIRKISEFQFTSASRIATLTNQDGAASQAQRVAQQSVNVLVGDFSVLELVPNRLQQQSGDGTPDSDTAFIFDPNFISISYLHGYRTYELAKVGLQDRREIAVDWGLRMHNWTALGGIVGIDPALAMTAA